MRDLVPGDDAMIRLVHLEQASEIGLKRNFGCQLARGEIIAHWDDDDWSAPERLADQVARIEQSGKAVTGYGGMRFTDGSSWWEYIPNNSNPALGTSLCYRRSWCLEHPFLALQIGEDGEFVAEAVRHGQLSAVEAGELMYATIHPGNTSPRNLAQRVYRKLS